jgi:hypothetical protein
MANPIFLPFDNFANVPDALAPISANTETKVCVTDCANNTATFTNTPHPTFTNGRGKSIVQMNLVQLGGENGVYY